MSLQGSSKDKYRCFYCGIFMSRDYPLSYEVYSGNTYLGDCCEKCYYKKEGDE